MNENISATYENEAPQEKRPLKVFLRALISRIPGIRHWVARRIFFSSKNTHRFWGVYKTAAEAKKRVPANFHQNFDAPGLDENFDHTIQPRDLPVIHILARILPESKTLFDLGGNIGLSFYQFKGMITYPPALRWTICDVPFVNEAGRRIAQKKGETQLTFTDDRQLANGTDIYLTFGALQYFEKTLAEILSELAVKPGRVLINRVPLTTDPSFYTLQHMGYSIVPYHVLNVDEFITSMEAIGYQLEEKWKSDRLFELILRDDKAAPAYHGFHFKKI
jgi:putative methyltransferase (TIGR04325 family)